MGAPLLALDTALTSVSAVTTKAQRQQLLADIKTCLAHLDPTFEVDDEPREMTIRILSPNLSADIWLHQSHPAELISWFKADGCLKAVPGAWKEADINPCHRHKASSFPASLNEMLSMLMTGFKAAFDRSAFA